MYDEPIKHLFEDFKKRILIIILATIIGALLGLVASIFSKSSYVGELTFVLEDSKSNSLGGYASLASQFGIDLSSNGGGAFQGENILQLLKSRLLIDKTLASAYDNKQTIEEAYFESSDLKEQFKSKGYTYKILMDTNNVKSKIPRDSLRKIIFEKVIRENLLLEKPDKKNTFIKVTFKSNVEQLAKIFPEKLVSEAIRFYTVTKTQRSLLNVDKLQAKADSILFIMNNKTYEAASNQDVNVNPLKKQSTIPLELTIRDKAILQTMYGEVVKNLELAKINVAQETPLVQIVDTPILPLNKVKLRKLEAIFLGGIFGFVIITFILIIFIVTKNIYKN
ncbi:MAG: hypothetical protein QM541_06335 [Flavobacterium sp.]|nr:hypothetical protein [Flavobacterium sp.]